MFRAQQNTFDESVAKATDENLTSENWEYIMDVVDKVGPQDARANDVVAALIKRLAHRNANVQLYTLELANALSQNCGPNLHRELASRSFTDALLRLAGDRNTHTQVKAKILERTEDWTKMFSKNPDLGIMEQAFMRLRSQNPNLHPPSKPVKSQITEADRRKEEEELQMALALSIKDKVNISQPSNKSESKNQAASAVSSSATSQPTPSSTMHSNTAAAPTSVPSGTTAATVSRVRALYDFQPSEPGELQFRKGDIIAVLESVYKDWWKGSLRGQTGIFPLNYVEKLQDPTKEELEREAQMEAEVFAQIRNVEKLLALLSTSSKAGIGGMDGDIRENEGITELYHSTLAIRPKLIELIGKYSQKKDDFTQLNEKFIKARRDYESLLEASMAQPPQHQQHYGRPAYNFSPAPSAYAGVSPAPQQRYPQQGHPHQQGSPAPHDQYPLQHHQQSFNQHSQTAYPPQQQQQPPTQMNPPQQNYSTAPTQLHTQPQQAYSQPGKIGVAGVAAGGFPSELATTAYDAPIDGQQSYAPHQLPPQQHQPQHQPQPQYESYNPQRPYSNVPPTHLQAQPAQHQPPYDTPTSTYTGGPDDHAYPAPQQAQTSAAVPSVLQPYGAVGGQQQAQAYAPAQTQQQQAGGPIPSPAAYPPSSSGYVAYQPGMVVVGQGGDGRRDGVE